MKIFIQWAVGLALLVVAGSAGAVDAEVRQTIVDAIHKLVPKATVESVEKAPIGDLYVVIASGQVVYVSADGKYMMQGKLYDLTTRTDLTSQRMNKVRKAALAEIDSSQSIVFAPENPKYHVTVFTDIDCGYCRKLHSHIQEFNKEGIAVEYLFFPRAGIGSPSYDKAVSVWCADDQQKALTEAKVGQPPKPLECDNPVARDYNLGMQLGVTGTPTIITDDGSVIGGYLSPAQMLSTLQSLSGSDKAAEGS